MFRRCVLFSACLMALLAVGPRSSTQAQTLVGSGGRALDASLQLGSGGYNGGGFNRHRWNSNSFRRSTYRVTPGGNFAHGRSNSFYAQRRYNVGRSASVYNQQTQLHRSPYHNAGRVYYR